MGEIGTTLVEQLFDATPLTSFQVRSPNSARRDDAENLRAALPLDWLRLVDQTQIHLIDQCGGLQRLVWPAPAQVSPGERVEFPVDVRCELIQRGAVSFAPVVQQFCN